VLDGELVVWDGESGRLDFTALQRRVIAPARAGAYARQRPASVVAFDLLAEAGEPLASRPLRERRQRLEALVPLLEPPLQVTPATRDRDVAAVWLREYADAAVGIEGLVVKGLGDPYAPGRRGWLKLKTRTTAEAVVGAVTGTLARPERLILGLRDRDTGRLLVAGGTAPLTARSRHLWRRCCASRSVSTRGHPCCPLAGPAPLADRAACRSSLSSRRWWSRSTPTPPSSTAAGATSPASSASARTFHLPCRGSADDRA
jgi:hypothetical protein